MTVGAAVGNDETAAVVVFGVSSFTSTISNFEREPNRERTKRKKNEVFQTHY